MTLYRAYWQSLQTWWLGRHLWARHPARMCSSIWRHGRNWIRSLWRGWWLACKWSLRVIYLLVSIAPSTAFQQLLTSAWGFIQLSELCLVATQFPLVFRVEGCSELKPNLHLRLTEFWSDIKLQVWNVARVFFFSVSLLLSEYGMSQLVASYWSQLSLYSDLFCQNLSRWANLDKDSLFHERFKFSPTTLMSGTQFCILFLSFATKRLIPDF